MILGSLLIVNVGCAVEPAEDEGEQQESAIEGPFSSTSGSDATARVKEVRDLFDTMNSTREDFVSLTFFRVRTGIHIYYGVRLVRKVKGKEEAHNFVLGLANKSDITDFESKIAGGTITTDASETFSFTDYDKASKALSGAIDISKSSAYATNDFAYYGGMIFTPLGGRPCANVAEEITNFLKTVK